MAVATVAGSRLAFLSAEEIRRIHFAVLEVLEEVGVKVEFRPALELFADAGCRVDFEGRIVQVPEHVLRRALSTAPSRFTLYGLSPEFDISVDTESIYTIGGSSALYVLDLDGVRRPARLADLADLTRLQDALENLHIMHAIVVPQDIAQEGFDRILFSTVVKNTRRNYYSQGQGAQSIRDQIEMASVIRGSSEEVRKHPFFTICVCLISPLIQPAMRLAELMEAAKNHIPLYIEVDSMPGATTPITLAGTLVEECANVLCGVTLAQLVNPGTPCIFSIASGIMDMSTGNYCGAAPETDLLHAATAQMAHFYGLPFQGGTGIEATVSDAQAGYERALQVLTCGLAGVNFIHLSVGMMEQMLLAGYEQCLIDNEILGATFRILKGIEVTRDTIALDVIKEVGPGGNFLAHPHTAKYLRPHYWFPKLTNRNKWEAWQRAGGMDMRQRANQQARRILQEHFPSLLSEEQAAEVDRMAVSAQNRAIEKAQRSGA